MLRNYLDVISKSALFEGIDTQNIAGMLKCLTPIARNYKRNDMITLAGEPFTGIGILLKGEASVSKETPSGNRMVIHMIKPGDMFGEMIAFSDHSTWPATVQAVGILRHYSSPGTGLSTNASGYAHGIVPSSKTC